MAVAGKAEGPLDGRQTLPRPQPCPLAVGTNGRYSLLYPASIRMVEEGREPEFNKGGGGVDPPPVKEGGVPPEQCCGQKPTFGSGKELG